PALLSKNHIVLTVASSGITSLSLLLSEEDTTHSKLAIPIPTHENSTCNIHRGSELLELLKQTKFIIWDEAPMTHKYCFEALDKTLTDIMSFRGKENSIFGGKTNFSVNSKRQSFKHYQCYNKFLIYLGQLPSINFNKKYATINNINHLQIQQFAKWILDVGDGKLSESNDGYALIEIPEQFLITNYDNSIHAILMNEEFLQCRTILASTIDTVDEINDYGVLSSDSIDRSESNDIEALRGLITEFLNSLKLKTEGLCNGTRMIVNRLATHVIEAKVMTGKNVGKIFYIPRMSLSPSHSPKHIHLCRFEVKIWVSSSLPMHHFYMYNKLILESIAHCHRVEDKILDAGEELCQETLPLQGGSRFYHIQRLKPHMWYEVKISYPASIPASFSLQLKRDKSSMELKSNRRLLNTEKLIFKSYSDQDKTYVLVTVEPEGVPAKPYIRERQFIIFNIVCDELLLGIPHKAWWVVALALLCLGIALVIPYFLPSYLLPKKQVLRSADNHLLIDDVHKLTHAFFPKCELKLGPSEVLSQLEKLDGVPRIEHEMCTDKLASSGSGLHLPIKLRLC
ncbi:hypothetical protein Lal_00010041, partial [Lupinus albus]